MKLRGLFILNLKTFIIDLVIFIIGIFLYSSSIVCFAGPCPQPNIHYVGMVLILISIIHFIISLIIFIYKKFNRTKKKK